MLQIHANCMAAQESQGCDWTPSLAISTWKSKALARLLLAALLCNFSMLALTGCEAPTIIKGDAMEDIKAFFAVDDGKSFHRGCTMETLIPQLQLDGNVGLTEEQISTAGMSICTVPGGLGASCIKPEKYIYTEVDVMCPFLFNVWDLSTKEKYGRGEAQELRQKMVVRCNYEEAKHGVGPRWCFTGDCLKVPLNCFSSQKAAEAAKPWEQTASSNVSAMWAQERSERSDGERSKSEGKLQESASDQVRSKSEPTSVESQHGVEAPAPSKDTSENPREFGPLAPAAAPAPNPGQRGENEASLAESHEVVTAIQHKHRGARRSSFQVTQGAFIAVSP